jgi:hypothetical protein
MPTLSAPNPAQFGGFVRICMEKAETPFSGCSATGLPLFRLGGSQARVDFGSANQFAWASNGSVWFLTPLHVPV